MPQHITARATSSSTTSAGLGRRRVLQAGVWAAPAISIVTAAPAFASCSSGPAVLTFTSAAGKWQLASGRNYIRYDFTLVNTGGTATGPIDVVVELPTSLSNVYYGRDWKDVTTNWTVSVRDGSDGDLYPEYLNLTGPALACGSEVSFTATIRVYDALTGTGSNIGDLLTQTVNATSGSVTTATSLTLTT